jgi:hypothetical protein
MRAEGGVEPGDAALPADYVPIVPGDVALARIDVLRADVDAALAGGDVPFATAGIVSGHDTNALKADAALSSRALRCAQGRLREGSCRAELEPRGE